MLLDRAGSSPVVVHRRAAMTNFTALGDPTRTASPVSMVVAARAATAGFGLRSIYSRDCSTMIDSWCCSGCTPLGLDSGEEYRFIPTTHLEICTFQKYF